MAAANLLPENVAAMSVSPKTNVVFVGEADPMNVAFVGAKVLESVVAI